MGLLPSVGGLVHRSLAFVNGAVIGTVIGAAVVAELGLSPVELVSVVELAIVGALVASVFTGYKWLAGVSGGITGGLLAIGFAVLGVPPVPSLEEWLTKFVVVAIVVRLLPTVGRT